MQSLKWPKFTAFLGEGTMKGLGSTKIHEFNRALACCVTESELMITLQSWAEQNLPNCSGAIYRTTEIAHTFERQLSWGKIEFESIISNIDCVALRAPSGQLANQLVPCKHTHCDGVTEICIPILNDTAFYGVIILAISDVPPRHYFAILRIIAETFAIHMGIQQRTGELIHHSYKDRLTGMYNRRFFDEAIARECLRADREQTCLSLAIIDIDHFKLINDQYGHPFGDNVLRKIAESVDKEVRQSDWVCRYGGEEIAVLLPRCSVETALECAERVRLGCAASSSACGLQSITVSIGVSSSGSSSITASALLAQADQALYRAKQSGRNRVIYAPAEFLAVK
jgi:diguanylate cyclase (GGDEF)-like protein